eukprot:COSAG02_NODE_1845_length_10683_cov_10.656085_1_plen_71_part_00
MIQGCSIELPFFFGQFLIDRIEFQLPDVPPTDPIMIYIMIHRSSLIKNPEHLFGNTAFLIRSTTDTISKS